MHLSPEFGLTYTEIEKDGYHIDKKIEMIVSSDTPQAISKSTGLGLIGFADALDDLKPDIVVLLGDRYEILAASIAAFFAKIPIAHFSGGETTLGAFDESIRHSITKMSWWHFVAAKEYKKRLRQLGENPQLIFNVGSLGVSAIKKTKLLSKLKLMEKTGIKFHKKNIIVTYHSVTHEKKTSENDFLILLEVLDNYRDIYFIFTMPNSDTDGRVIKKMIDEFVSKNKHRSIAFSSMGQLNYLSTMQYVDGVIGNSSSGLSEAPIFKIGTINIGDRQKGRLKARSVIDCDNTKESIKNSIDKLYSKNFQNLLPSLKSPYGECDETKVMQFLRDSPIPKDLKKEFHDF